MDDKDIYQLQTEIAVLKEKVKRMEAFIYIGVSLIVPNIIGLFILWAKDALSK